MSCISDDGVSPNIGYTAINFLPSFTDFSRIAYILAESGTAYGSNSTTDEYSLSSIRVVRNKNKSSPFSFVISIFEKLDNPGILSESPLSLIIVQG